jgi:hypothetical protein
MIIPGQDLLGPAPQAEQRFAFGHLPKRKAALLCALRSSVVNKSNCGLSYLGIYELKPNTKHRPSSWLNRSYPVYPVHPC